MVAAVRADTLRGLLLDTRMVGLTRMVGIYPSNGVHHNSTHRAPIECKLVSKNEHHALAAATVFALHVGCGWVSSAFDCNPGTRVLPSVLRDVINAVT
jgi:hypothetical protein